MHDGKVRMKLFNDLFTRSWGCAISIDNLALIQGRTEELDLHPVAPDRANRGTCNDYRAVVTENRGHDSEILAMLDYMPVITQDMEDYADIVPITTVNPTRLNIANIAEVVAAGGDVTITDIRDTAEIHSIITRYELDLLQRKAHQPHFIMPPAEDMRAFANLRELVTEMAKMISDAGGGNMPLDMLAGVFGLTSVGSKMLEDDKIPSAVISGKGQRVTIASEFVGGSPYDFRR